MGQNQNISGPIQMMGDTKGEVGVLQILSGVLAQCNKKIATVAAQGEI